MTRVAPTHAVDLNWRAASAASPCPICGSEEGCQRHIDNNFVSCSQQRSEWPLTNGSWLHRIEIGPMPRSAA
jgi:hypothetical protein